MQTHHIQHQRTVHNLGDKIMNLLTFITLLGQQMLNGTVNTNIFNDVMPRMLTNLSNSSASL